MTMRTMTTIMKPTYTNTRVDNENHNNYHTKIKPTYTNTRVDNHDNENYDTKIKPTIVDNHDNENYNSYDTKINLPTPIQKLTTVAIRTMTTMMPS